MKKKKPWENYVKGPVHFWGNDVMWKSTKFRAFFAFTALLENLTVKSYEQNKKFSNEFVH
jgi:hypothetical protein